MAEWSSLYSQKFIPSPGSMGDQEDTWQMMDKESQRGTALCWYQQLASVFSSIKSVFGPSKSKYAPLLPADGTTLVKDKAGINSR